MDNRNPSYLDGNPQRRRLVKKSSHHYSRSSSGLDSAHDAHSIHSKRSSSNSLRRTPSAPPPVRPNNNIPGAFAASTSPSSRHPNQAQQQPSNASPLLQHGHFAAVAAPASSSSASSSRLAYRNSPTSHPDPQFRQHAPAPAPADDFIGAPFDGAAILSSIDSASYHSAPTLAPSPASSTPSAAATTITTPRTSIPAQPQKSSSTSAAVARAAAPLIRAVSTKKPKPALRYSKSVAAMDVGSTIVEKSGARVEAQAATPKRYSDETGVPAKPPNTRKKSGFSGFVNSLVGSQKKPMISAPENPIHVTHVGYDSSTGQFTVCHRPRSSTTVMMTPANLMHRACPRNGSD